MQCPHQNRILARRGSRTVRATPSRPGCVSHVRSPAISPARPCGPPPCLYVGSRTVQAAHPIHCFCAVPRQFQHRPASGLPDFPGWPTPVRSPSTCGPPPFPAPSCFWPPGLSGLAPYQFDQHHRAVPRHCPESSCFWSPGLSGLTPTSSITITPAPQRHYVQFPPVLTIWRPQFPMLLDCPGCILPMHQMLTV